MKSTSANAPTHQYRIALLGDPGTRKTTVGLHFSIFEKKRGKHLYVADLDGNMSTAYSMFQEHYPDIEVFYDDYSEITQKEQRRLSKTMDKFNQASVFDIFLKNCEAALRSDKIGAIMIDSQSAINPILLDLCRGDKATMQLQDWGDFKARMQNLVLAIRSAGKILIWTVHQVAETEPVLDSKNNKVGERIVDYTFNIPGQTKNYFGSFFSDTWYLDLSRRGAGLVWSLATSPTSLQSHVKNSLNLPPVITLPNEYKQLNAALWNIVGPRYPQDS